MKLSSFLYVSPFHYADIWLKFIFDMKQNCHWNHWNTYNENTIMMMSFNDPKVFFHISNRIKENLQTWKCHRNCTDKKKWADDKSFHITLMANNKMKWKMVKTAVAHGTATISRSPLSTHVLRADTSSVRACIIFLIHGTICAVISAWIFIWTHLNGLYQIYFHISLIRLSEWNVQLC